MKHWLSSFSASLLSAAMLVVAVSPGCTSSQDRAGGSGEAKRIIFLTNGDDPFWDAARAGLEQAAEELNIEEAGLVAEQQRGDFTVQTQIDQLSRFATETDIAAVAVSVTDPANRQLMNAMRKLKDGGIKVITVDSDVNRGEFRDVRFAYLGTDNIVAGRQLGKAASVLRPDGGKYATFVGNAEQGNAIERINGFAEGAGANFEHVDTYTDRGDQLVAQDRVREALDNNPDLDMLVGIWAYNAHAIAKLVVERDRRDSTGVLCFDAQKIALDDMQQGQIDAMIVQNPYQMGYLSVKLLKAMVEEDHGRIAEVLTGYDAEKKDFSSPEGDIYHTELRLVVPSEESPIWEHREDETFHPDLIFFTLDGFREWLAERDLTSS
jgi:ribose transport system substrate-binding protein